MKIGLGTVQFGTDYGISNKRGQCPKDEVRAILSLAAQAGIEVLDTAALYGSAEQVLGELVGPEEEFRVVTKSATLSFAPHPALAVKALDSGFRRSLARLGRTAVDGLLIHDADDLCGPAGPHLWRKMRELRDAGLIGKIGVSFYTADQIDEVCARFLPDLVQIPINVFDQRLINSSHIDWLKAADVEIHARSTFLQGLLLMSATEVPPELAGITPALVRFRTAMAGAGLTPLAGALAFSLSRPEIDVVLVGVASLSELAEIVRTVEAIDVNGMDWKHFALEDPHILDPRAWPGLRANIARQQGRRYAGSAGG